VAIAALLATACQPASPVSVERLEVRLDLAPDGSLQVEERLRARLSDERFRLRKPLDHHDEVVDVVAALDAVDLSAGGAPPRVAIDTGDGLDVEWTPGGTGRSHDFSVRYRAVGAVAVRGGHAAISWPVLPAGHSLDVAAAAVEMTVPAGTQLSTDPYVEEGGWTTTVDGGAIHAETGRIAAGQPATLVVPFLVDPREIAEPRWQREASRARDLLPAFLSAGLFILAVAAGALVMVRAQYPRQRVRAADPARVAAARGLRIAGLVTTLFGLVLLPVTEWTLGQYGIWPHAMPISVIASGVALALYGARRQI
jgi:hypothetical protein